MSLLEFVAEKIIAQGFKALDKHLTSETANSKENSIPNLRQHLVEVSSWASTIEFYELSLAKSIEKATVELDIFLTPRKFRMKQEKRQKGEHFLLETDRHLILLGDPGAGKTTTIKRLCKLLLTEDTSSKNDFASYPLVVRLRKIESNSDLYLAIASVLGFRWTIRVEKVPDGKEKSAITEKQEVTESQRCATTELPPSTQGDLNGHGRNKVYYEIGGNPLADVVINFLNETGAFLLIDGLDEVPPTKRDEIERNLSTLAHKLTNSKMLITSRTGDYYRKIEGVDVVEISPLADEQIEEVVKKWLPKDYNSFLRELNVLPYRDTIRRPLSLVQVVVLYSNYGYFPEQPSIIYKKIIWLYLEGWDYHRRISRASKYAGFIPERKLEFLSAVAFQLTLKQKTARFDESALVAAYGRVYKLFGLPEYETTQVVQEIEAHTGLIIETGPQVYEFSHLSLQEYLCANYLVRSPITKDVGNYFVEKPGVLALAVVLSSNPNSWFASLFLASSTFEEIRKNTASLSEFIRRLVLERPNFDDDEGLGAAITAIAMEFHDNRLYRKIIPYFI
uniref:NACHT domain-containing protein n=1 Tax=Candidatus Kentrum sp. UNK TaxID=2126344 RepID=A0A451B530_9GAMM|nr:MAG: NACHT domain-containing protein [Candidatus Kentron sp. UNK]VFK73385.1 MAG: NACHT domain-containing protein [Candidatus Kentron sp. UNK]